MNDPVAALREAVAAPGTLFETVIEEVRGVPMPVFAHRARSLRELVAGSARFGDRTYLVDGARRIDFAEHLRLVDAFAAALQDRYGVRPGDRVALFAANRWDWIVAFWAITSAGGVACLCNGFWTPDETTDAVRLVDPVLIIGDAPRLERVGGTLPTVDLDGDLPDVLDVYRDRTPSVPAVTEDDPAVLIFTSGTTGRAKAVTVPHRAVIGFSHVNLFSETVGRVAMGGAVPQAGDALPPGDDVSLVTSPLFHVSMLYGAVLAGVVKGTTQVLLPGRFDPERVLRAIEAERVTFWMGLGSAAPRVCASPALGRYDTGSVRYVGIGGAPVSPAVQEALRVAFPTAARTLGMGYTSTEAGAVIANIAGPEFAAHPTSTGRPTMTVAVELRDELGAPVPPGELGEVHVRSPYVMLGYWNDPAATAAALKDDGWLAMGDMARLVDGRLHIDSRARDMILVSAENVSPTEVEYRLEAHPDVLEAAVLAVDDDVTGDAVGAVVVARGDLTVGALAEWCRAGLAHYKVPTVWRLVREPLPRTPSGKLIKHRLRAPLEALGTVRNGVAREGEPA